MLQATHSLSYLIEASKLLNSTLDYNKLISLAMELTTQALSAEACCLFLLDRRIHRSTSLDKFFSWKRNTKDFFNKSLCEALALRVLKEGKMYVSNNFAEENQDLQFRHDKNYRPVRSVICIPLKRHKATLGVLEAINKLDGGRFSEEDLDMLQALADLIAIALDNTRLYGELKRQSKEKHVLFEVGKKISSSLDLNQVLNAIIESLHKVVELDGVDIYLVEPETKTLKKTASKGHPQEFEKARLKFGEGIVGWVIKTGKPVIVPDVSKDPHYLNHRPDTKSELAAPIISKGKIIGAFNIESNKLDAYDKHDLELVTAFSSQAAISIEMAMLHEAVIEKRRLEEGIKIARRIQLASLPQRDPEYEGFEISGINIPSQEVSGDYYDFIKITEKDLGIAIGDVVGKGVPASIIMATFRAGLISEVRDHYSISEIMAAVNQILNESTEDNEFVTAVYGVLDLRWKVFTYSNAGHNYPLLRRANGNYETLVDGGLPLGLFKNVAYEERRLELRSGDMLVFYTDGVIETVNEQMEEFGLSRLTEIIERSHQNPPKTIIAEINKSLKEYRGNETQTDDITVIILKIK